MGILYIIYRRDVSKGFVKDVYEGSIYTTWGTNKDYIGLRPEVCNSILGNIHSKTRDLNGDFNSILFVNRQTNKETKLDIKIIPTILRQLYTKQLGIVTTSYIVRIQHNTTRRNQDVII